MSTLKTLEEMLVQGFNSMITEAKGSKDTAAKAAAKKKRQAKKAEKAAERTKRGMTDVFLGKYGSNRKTNKALKKALGPMRKVKPYEGDEPDPEPMEEQSLKVKIPVKSRNPQPKPKEDPNPIPGKKPPTKYKGSTPLDQR